MASSIRSIIRGQAVALVTGTATIMAPAVVGMAGMALSGVAAAQDYTSGVLSGRVVDIGGKAVGGADVTVVSQQGMTRKTTTDDNGGFRVPALPAGSYTVTVEKAGVGMQTSRASVAPGGSNYEFVLGERMAEVVVSAEAIRDVTATDTGLAVDVQELASQIPIGRSINSVTLLTPGASNADPSIVANGARRNQSLATIAGTSAAESVYYINGLNVTDQRTFLGYSELPFDFLKTVETKTGGYSAEFGRGTGGVVNMVTRSGTNEWEFGATVTYAPDSLRESRPLSYAPGGTNSAGQHIFNQTSEVDSTTYSVYVGGPVIKDRLFVFGIYEGRDYESWGSTSFSTPTTTTGTQFNTTYDDPFFGGKIDLVITDDHLLEGTIWSDKTTTYYQPWVVKRPAGSTSVGDFDFTRDDTTRSPSYQSESGGTNYILKYTGVFSDAFTLSALYGKVKSSYLDSGDAVNFPAVLDYGHPSGVPTYVNSRRFGLYNLRGEDERDTYRIDADFYFSAMGDHHLRVGYDQEDLTSDAYSAYNGGGIYYGDVGYVEIITFANNGVFKAEQSAAYLQDSWQLTDTFNLQLGVRWDKYDYQNLDGESYIKIDDQFAPRIGFTWDPFGNGRDRLFGSIGDYYLPIATNTSIRASGGEVYTDQFFEDVRNPDGTLTLDANGYPVLGDQIGVTDYYSPPFVPDPRQIAEKDIKPMYEREFSLGYEHTFESGFAEGWNAGVRVVYRDLKSTIEDTAIGDAMVRWCERTGTECGQAGPDDRDFASYFPYVLINPGDAATVWMDVNGDGPADLEGNANPDYNPQWVELTKEDLALPKADRTYKALELTFERPFDGKWSLRGSYVWAESKGNYEGAVKSDIGQTDTSITQDFDHAANMIGAKGYLPNHRAHTLKLFGNYAFFGEKMSIGANALAQSGRKYGCTGYVPLSVDPLAPQSGTPSGWYCPVGPYTGNGGLGTATARELVGRGNGGTTDWEYRFDLNFVWNVMDGDNGRLQLRADIFNVFDFDATTRVVEQGEIRRAETASKGYPSAFYGQARTYQAPRSIRLSASYSF